MEVIFVHGALVRDGEWWWHRAAELLYKRTGIRIRAVALPSCGETPTVDAAGGLAADAAALRAELDRTDTAIVVGHSYGGTVIAEAGQHPAVARLFYISSYLPEIGQSQASIMSGERDPVNIAGGDDGLLRVSGYTAASFGARFLQDGDASLQQQAWERVTAQAASAFVTPTSRAGWEGVDSTYVVCADDRSTSVELQRSHASRATRSIELATGHHPFLTAPGLVVDLLAALAGDSPPRQAAPAPTRVAREDS